MSEDIKSSFMAVLQKAAVTSVEGTLIALWQDTELSPSHKRRRFDKELNKVGLYSKTFACEMRRKIQPKLMAESVGKWLNEP